jgi:hypothetical protein
MKIGILTFNTAINFGANLQACSTYCYLKSHGYEPVFISYTPNDAVDEGMSNPPEQVAAQRAFQKQFNVTEPCHDSKEVAQMLKNSNIRNIIVGSDAVAQHHPLLSRIVFPSKHLISVSHPASDKIFPNPFWGEFLDYVDLPVSVFLMSVSNQQSNYKLFTSKEKKAMMSYLSRMTYISVRDNWTQNMYKFISGGKLIPDITPDPVFAFNENVKNLPTRDFIKRKFNLPEKYILLAIRRGRSVAPVWVESFERICVDNGYKCIGLPFPYGYSPLNVVKEKINLPLSPIDWYSIIKYSDGYVGHNMHSIVSALHNSVPCYSFDQYGIRHLSQFVNKQSSKIYHILNTAGFPNYRNASCRLLEMTPPAETIFNKLMTFDKKHCSEFAEDYYQKYIRMMKTIESMFV